MKDFEISINPVETYKSPEIPVFGSDNSALLKKLPSRWQKNAKILACLGIVGTLALSGCGVESPSSGADGQGGASGAYYAAYINGFGIHHNLGSLHGSYRGYGDAELNVRLHHGGANLSTYVVHLTEQEAYGIIRARLEAAGLNFDSAPPGYSVGFPYVWGVWGEEITLDLFDRQRDVAVAHISWEQNRGRTSAMSVERGFAEQTDITVGAIYTPGTWAGRFGTSRARAHRIAGRSRPELVRSLINQVDTFIFVLQYEGILEPYPNVDVIIDGTSIIFGEFPVLINNHKMVPATAAFEELGMTVGMDDWGGMFARKGDILITVRYNHSRPIMWVNNDDIDMDIPVIAHNDQVLVPLQFVARTIGAAVEWDDVAREIRITTS